MAFLQQDYDNAQTFLNNSLKRSEEVGILRRIAATKRLLGDVARSRLEHEAASGYYQDALQLLQRLGDRPQICRTLVSLGQLELAKGSWDVALSFFVQAKQSYRNLNDPRGIVATCFFLMRLYFRRRNFIWAANELADGVETGLKGGLVSWVVIVGALKRWGKW